MSIVQPPRPARPAKSKVPVWVWIVVGVAVVVICLGCLGFLGYAAREGEREQQRPTGQLPTVTVTKCEISNSEAVVAYSVVNTGASRTVRMQLVVRDSAGLQVGSLQRSVEVDAKAKVDESVTVTLDAAGGKSCEVTDLR